MTLQRARRLAWSSFGLTVALCLVGAVFHAMSWQVPVPPSLFAHKGYSIPLALAIGGSGAVIASRRPENPIGWIFCMVGIATAVQAAGEGYAFWALLDRGGTAGSGIWAAWLQEWVWIPCVASIGVVAALFPDGRWYSHRWRNLIVVGLVGTAIAMILGALTPELTVIAGRANPIGLNGIDLEAFTNLASIPFIFVPITLVGGAASSFVRYRHADGDERQQLKWLVLAATFVAVSLGAYISFAAATGWSSNIDVGWAENLITAAFLTIPIAIAIGIVRYRLFDIDVVIKKTVVFAIVVVVLTVVYLGAIALFTGGGVVGGLLIALTFQPVRVGARRIADLLVYGKRATPYEVLAEFSEKIGGTYAADDVLPRMAVLLREATGASIARVWLGVGGEAHAVASAPSDAPPASTLPNDAAPVAYHGATLGALSVEMPANDPLDPTRRKLVHDLAAQAGPVLSNVRLIEDLRSSRRRIVSAQDLRAKKLERDIHDGAQQQLVALAVKQRLAASLVGRDDDRARAILADLQADTIEALENLRDLARGIYPPLLADRGLAAALEAQARKAAVPTTVTADGVGRYPQDVESTVYFCCLEGLNNVAKYAEASSATVELAQSNGTLVFSVRDDGRGFDVASAWNGTGLQGMADRLDALGGNLRVESSPGGGTIVGGSIDIAEHTG
ncbi:MAG: histidine kinase [Actinomycetota bacterium]